MQKKLIFQPPNSSLAIDSRCKMKGKLIGAKGLIVGLLGTFFCLMLTKMKNK
jgi:hypothetical protein